MIDAEKNLWCAVVDQAVADAMTRPQVGVRSGLLPEWQLRQAAKRLILARQPRRLSPKEIEDRANELLLNNFYEVVAEAKGRLDPRSTKPPNEDQINRAARRMVMAKQQPLTGKEIKAQVDEMLITSSNLVVKEVRRYTVQDQARLRSQARSWLTENSSDFCLVCNLAGLDPEATHERMRGLAFRGWSNDGQKYSKLHRNTV